MNDLQPPSKREILRSWLPKRVDRYLFAEWFLPFLGSIAFLSFILLMFQALRLADSLIIHGASGLILSQIIGLMLVTFLPMSLPLAFLLACLIAFQRLSLDSEMTAFKSSGISLLRLSRYMFILASVIAALSLVLYFSWIPRTERLLKSTFVRMSNTKAVSAIKEGTFTAGFFDLLIYADKVDSDTNQLEKVFIYDERDPQSPLTVVAKRGEMIPVETDDPLGASTALKLMDGSIHSQSVQGNVIRKIGFEEYQLFLQITGGAENMTVKPKHLTYSQLREKMKVTTETEPKRELEGELWKRVASSLAPFLFVILGMGLGTARSRNPRAGPMVMTLLCVLPYWLLQGLGMKLSILGFPPALVSFIPHFVLGLVGIKFFRDASW